MRGTSTHPHPRAAASQQGWQTPDLLRRSATQKDNYNRLDANRKQEKNPRMGVWIALAGPQGQQAPDLGVGIPKRLEVLET